MTVKPRSPTRCTVQRRTEELSEEGSSVTPDLYSRSLTTIGTSPKDQRGLKSGRRHRRESGKRYGGKTSRRSSRGRKDNSTRESPSTTNVDTDQSVERRIEDSIKK